MSDSPREEPALRLLGLGGIPLLSRWRQRSPLRQSGKQNLEGRNGAFVSFPRGIPHTFSIDSASAHFLVFNTPGGFVKMFTLGPKTPEEAERAMTAYGMTVLGPHPRQAAAA